MTRKTYAMVKYGDKYVVREVNYRGGHLSYISENLELEANSPAELMRLVKHVASDVWDFPFIDGDFHRERLSKSAIPQPQQFDQWGDAAGRFWENKKRDDPAA